MSYGENKNNYCSIINAINNTSASKSHKYIQEILGRPI